MAPERMQHSHFWDVSSMEPSSQDFLGLLIFCLETGTFCLLDPGGSTFTLLYFLSCSLGVGKEPDQGGGTRRTPPPHTSPRALPPSPARRPFLPSGLSPPTAPRSGAGLGTGGGGGSVRGGGCCGAGRAVGKEEPARRQSLAAGWGGSEECRRRGSRPAAAPCRAVPSRAALPPVMLSGPSA